MSKINRAPEVSVIICALNAALTLPRQLKALENQETKLPYEVILVDNGSEDDTHALWKHGLRNPERISLRSRSWTPPQLQVFPRRVTPVHVPHR